MLPASFMAASISSGVGAQPPRLPACLAHAASTPLFFRRVQPGLSFRASSPGAAEDAPKGRSLGAAEGAADAEEIEAIEAVGATIEATGPAALLIGICAGSGAMPGPSWQLDSSAARRTARWRRMRPQPTPT